MYYKVKISEVKDRLNTMAALGELYSLTPKEAKAELNRLLGSETNPYFYGMFYGKMDNGIERGTEIYLTEKDKIKTLMGEVGTTLIVEEYKDEFDLQNEEEEKMREWYDALPAEMKEKIDRWVEMSGPHKGNK